MSAAVIKMVNQAGRITEREVQRKTVETDTKTGQGTVTFRIDDAQGGNYVLRVAGIDRFNNAIVADRAIYVSGKQDETKLRILAERQRYKVGEEASVNLHSRGRAGTALLTWEADRILTYKLVTVSDGDNPIGWAIDGPQFPNFTLTAARMWENKFDEAKLDIEVERDLRVTVAPVKPLVGPGDDVELEVTTVDQLGRPASAEISIAMIDRSLLRLYGDRMPSIGPFFYNQTRTGAFSTEATNTFHYAPATIAVAQAVVDEAERIAAVTANAAGQADVQEELRRQVATNHNFFALEPGDSFASRCSARHDCISCRSETHRRRYDGNDGRHGRGGKRQHVRKGRGRSKKGGLQVKYQAVAKSPAMGNADERPSEERQNSRGRWT